MGEKSQSTIIHNINHANNTHTHWSHPPKKKTNNTGDAALGERGMGQAAHILAVCFRLQLHQRLAGVQELVERNRIVGHGGHGCRQGSQHCGVGMDVSGGWGVEKREGMQAASGCAVQTVCADTITVRTGRLGASGNRHGAWEHARERRAAAVGSPCVVFGRASWAMPQPLVPAAAPCWLALRFCGSGAQHIIA